jgi:hypothetical protein
VEKQICAVTGMLPNEHCPLVNEIFIPGTEPTETCTLHQAFMVDRDTGKLCTVFTPPELCEERVFEVYPPEAADWLASLPEDRRPSTPPTEYDVIPGQTPATAEVAITYPAPYSYVAGGVITVTGNAKGGDFAFYRLTFGQGMNPPAWTQIGPDHNNQVDNNVLEYWDMTGLDGLYSLQLLAVGQNQAVRPATIQVTVDNISPTVELTNPEEGKEYILGKDEWVNVNADVADNYALGRVEFYHNDEEAPFAVRTVPPYNVNWLLSGAGVGEHKFRAVAFDAAGNRMEAEVVTVKVKVEEPTPTPAP